MLGATDQGWLPGEPAFVGLSAGAVLVTTVMLWLRVRAVVSFYVAAAIVFGCYEGWRIASCIRSENYDGPWVLAFLVVMGLCPFAAALMVALWGADFCRQAKTDAQPCAAPNGGPAAPVEHSRLTERPPSVS